MLNWDGMAITTCYPPTELTTYTQSHPLPTLSHNLHHNHNINPISPVTPISPILPITLRLAITNPSYHKYSTTIYHRCKSGPCPSSTGNASIRYYSTLAASMGVGSFPPSHIPYQTICR